MKNVFNLFVLICLLGLAFPAEAAVLHPKPKPADTERTVEAPAHQLNKKEERKLRREQRREFRKALRAELRKARKAGNNSDVEVVLLIIIALILPPLAMFLYDGGASSRFWITLVLSLAGFLLWGILGFLGSLAALASVLFALWVIISESF
ncbi:MAG: YqaE/Pmp3 family membrane protein [Bacteroidetes bacterium]|nr:MAG: YqaE/Pmp3 family membrane protein [Bacteroidota bacterium]